MPKTWARFGTSRFEVLSTYVQAFLSRPRLVHSSVTNIKVIPDMYGKWFPYSELTTSICLKYNIAHDVWDCKVALPNG
ncbi:hypothetical protein K439DRAFT_1640793 [Ramaria rubella]|nr:hypothetical protein K439DRAFT_1640793 [Ramaria rubella]